jgi:plasmid stabilization system protein ParE
MKRRSLVVTPQARRDLLDIAAWYRDNLGPSAAAKVAKTLRAGLETACAITPEAARRPDLPDGFLRVVAKTHLIIFQIDGEVTRVVRVVHGSRDLPGLLGADKA